MLHEDLLGALFEISIASLRYLLVLKHGREEVVEYSECIEIYEMISREHL